MVFVNSSGPIPGMDFGFPDTCNTPMGPVITPVPYPNFAMSVTAVPTQFSTYISCMPAHNISTMKPMTMGDTTGVLGGLASGMMMGPAMHMMGSTNLFIGGPPATKFLGVTGQNGMSPNAPGVTMAPSQPIMMSLR